MDDKKLIVRVPNAVIDRFRVVTKEKSHNQSALVREWITDYLSSKEEYKMYDALRMYFTTGSKWGGELGQEFKHFMAWCVKNNFENESFWNLVNMVSVRDLKMEEIGDWIGSVEDWVVGEELKEFQKYVEEK